MLQVACKGRVELPNDAEVMSLFEKMNEEYFLASDIFIRDRLIRIEILSNEEVIGHPKSTGVSFKSNEDLTLLMKHKLGVNLINSRNLNGHNSPINEVEFHLSRQGFVFAGAVKGVVHIIDDEGVEHRQSLDNIDKSDVGIHGVKLYRKLKPNWYIFYQFSP